MLISLNRSGDVFYSGLFTSKFLDVEFEHKRIGIMIDSATEVRKIPKSNIEKVTAILDENIEYKYADAIIKLNEGKRMVLLLDLSFILNFM